MRRCQPRLCPTEPPSRGEPPLPAGAANSPGGVTAPGMCLMVELLVASSPAQAHKGIPAGSSVAQPCWIPERSARLIPATGAAIPGACSSLPFPPCSTSHWLPGQPWAQSRILLLLLITHPLNAPTYLLAPAQLCCTGSP